MSYVNPFRPLGADLDGHPDYQDQDDDAVGNAVDEPWFDPATGELTRVRPAAAGTGGRGE